MAWHQIPFVRLIKYYYKMLGDIFVFNNWIVYTLYVTFYDNAFANFLFGWPRQRCLTPQPWCPRQPRKRIREMCCLCTNTNLVAWVDIVCNHTVYCAPRANSVSIKTFRSLLVQKYILFATVTKSFHAKLYLQTSNSCVVRS